MSIIKQLPKEVFEKIKAGEVIEDPASLVRELLDNAIDAGAKKILLESEEGGMSKIVVSDNGKGMDHTDLKLCYLPHTTSKIKDFEDIFRLQTVGFRGEALASISRVAFVKISSTDTDAGMAHYIHVEGGNLTQEGAEARDRGTTITVQNLFYNIPVRKNFLKSPVAENRKIKEEFLVRALSYPEIEMTLRFNGAVVFHFEPQDWEERIKTIFKEEKDALRSFASRSAEISVKGVITDEKTSFKTSGNLYFFVNNRYLKPRFLYGVVNSIFSSLLPRGRYPGGVFYIHTDPKYIDPNVHPSKKEIKIKVEDQIYSQVYRALREVFYGKESGSASFSSPHKENIHPESNFQNPLPSFTTDLSNPRPPQEQTYNLNFEGRNEALGHEENKASSPLPPVPEYHYLGTVFSTYLVAECQDKLLFVDFHAAHERKRYEELKAQTDQLEEQPLLHPRILNFKNAELEIILEKKSFLENSGFQFYAFGENSLVVKSVPAFYQGKDWEEDFHALLSRVEHNPITPAEVKDELLKRAACRGSYMSGDRLPEKEARELLDQVLARRFPLSCPHGRPFIHEISRDELSAKFLRGAKP